LTILRSLGGVFSLLLCSSVNEGEDEPESTGSNP
jgi:hypothetical protein